MEGKGILFIRKSNAQIGGVEMQMFRIASWLKKHHGFRIFLGTDDLNGNLAALFKSNGMEIFYCSLSGRFYFFDAVCQILKYLKVHNIKLIQAHMFRESMICRIVRLLKPSLTHYFRVETYIDCSEISRFKKGCYHLMAFFSGWGVDKYFANGKIVFDELTKRSYTKSHKIEVIYNGVEPYGKIDRTSLMPHRDNFLPVAMVANLIPGKGHLLLFEALALLQKSNIKIRVSLFGDEIGDNNTRNYKGILKESIEKLMISESVVFRGFSENLNIELEQFQVVVLPSYSEGTPNCILETMSMRKLLIVSDAGEIPYLVVNGESGLIHKVGDVSELAMHLKNVCNNYTTIEAIRDNAYLRWQKLFSLDQMMFALNKYYIMDAK